MLKGMTMCYAGLHCVSVTLCYDGVYSASAEQMVLRKITMC